MTTARRITELVEMRTDGSKEQTQPTTETGKTERKSQADQVADAMYNDDAELWHDTEGKAWMTFRRDGHSEHWPLRSKVISALVDATYYKTTGKTLRSQARQDAITRLEAFGAVRW